MSSVLVFFCFLLKIIIAVGKLDGFIVGGEYAPIEKYPHSVYLVITELFQGYVIGWECGSSLLNQRILLTAAHCLESKKLHQIIAHVGHSDKRKGKVYYGDNYKLHQMYVSVTMANDIGLIRTERDIMMGDTVKRISILPRAPRAYYAGLTGWGLVKEKPELITSDLHYIELKVWKRGDCQKHLRNIPVGAFCAGALDSHKYAARGDSGSALFIIDYIEIGIVSYKIGRVSPSLIVFTNVSYFYNWIKKKSKKMYCGKP